MMIDMLTGGHRGEVRPDLFDRYRTMFRPVAIDADVAALTVTGQAAVTVSIEMDRTMMRVAPNSHGIVTQHQLGRVRQLEMNQLLLDRVPALRLLQALAMIVIAGQEMAVTIETGQIPVVVVGEGKVAEIVKDVARLHAGIVRSDQRLIHLGDR